jgi:hypothetical protein
MVKVSSEAKKLILKEMILALVALFVLHLLLVGIVKLADGYRTWSSVWRDILAAALPVYPIAAIAGAVGGCIKAWRQGGFHSSK